MDKNLIIEKIEKIMPESFYIHTYIGVTNDPERRIKEHKDQGEDVTGWRGWKADSVDDAREIENYFQSLGMKGSGGGGEEEDPPNWVYIF